MNILLLAIIAILSGSLWSEREVIRIKSESEDGLQVSEARLARGVCLISRHENNWTPFLISKFGKKSQTAWAAF